MIALLFIVSYKFVLDDQLELTGSNIWGYGVDFDIPGVLPQRVGHIGFYVARHTGGECWVINRERDRGRSEPCQVPESSRPIVWSAMQSIVSIVLGSVVSNTIKSELPIADAVGISAWNL